MNETDAAMYLEHYSIYLSIYMYMGLARPKADKHFMQCRDLAQLEPYSMEYGCRSLWSY
jgi:hypothetical protein